MIDSLYSNCLYTSYPIDIKIITQPNSLLKMGNLYNTKRVMSRKPTQAMKQKKKKDDRFFLLLKILSHYNKQ